MSVKDPKKFWQNISKQANWKDYILPRKEAADFDIEGLREAERLYYFFDNSCTIVDYGCGIGRVLKYTAPRAKCAIGLDINQDFLEKAQKYIGSDNVQLFESSTYREKEVADFLYCLMVFQHNDFEQRELIISHIKEILKMSGRALINFPRYESTYYQETEFVHKFRKQEVETYGKRFSAYSIIEGSFPNYEKEYDKSISHEYFLKVVK